MTWRNPNDVPPEYQSRPTDVTLVLVAVPRHYPHPVLGYYVSSLRQWHVVGSPSTFQPTAWQPLPPMPGE